MRIVGVCMDQDKEWLFKENIRLNKLSEELDQKEKQFLEEKRFFEQQKKALEIGFQKLAADKEMFAAQIKKEKSRLNAMRYETENEQNVFHNDKLSGFTGPGFFGGVTGVNSLRKRYKELLKIYHPDNKYGDSFTVACINKEYEIMKEKLSAKK